MPKESNKYKAPDAVAANAIGDKIDLRICHLSPGGEVLDLLYVEFAKDGNNDKYFKDHRKVLREAKVNVDRFYRNNYLKPRKKKRTISDHCIQIAGTEENIGRVRLVDKGLYVANHVGSLRLPSPRTLLGRLFTLKDDLLSQHEHFDAMEHERVARKKSMETKQDNQRSPYENGFDDNSSNSSLSSYSSQESAASNEKFTSWVRASWFPPAVKKGR